ncbi:hypothetical protein LCGC14_0960050, partial [marine sediment metagenome]
MKKTLKIENLDVAVYEEPIAMGRAAANYVQKKLTEAIGRKGSANLILATGSSQFKFLEALMEIDIDWKKITVFHLDEYKDISDTHPASFRKYLKERILDAVNPKKIYFLNGDAENVETEMQQYATA